jgi:hypothetical protein
MRGDVGPLTPTVRPLRIGNTCCLPPGERATQALHTTSMLTQADACSAFGRLPAEAR